MKSHIFHISSAFKMIKIKNSAPVFFNPFTNLTKCLFATSIKEETRMFTPPIQTKFQIINKEKINHDCYIYRFKFHGPSFPLKIGQHFKIMATIPTVDFPKG